MKTLRLIIEKFALANAHIHKGKANNKVVLNKVLAHSPKWRDKIHLVGPEVKKIIEKVNQLAQHEREKKLRRLWPGFIEQSKEKKDKVIVDLPKAQIGKVITRIPPDPSKHIHIGHATSFLINYMYAQKYKGKCVLRFDDTNPELVRKEYVDSIIDDIIDYLKIKPYRTIFASNDIPKFYELANNLIKYNKAYVCFCSIENLRKKRKFGHACSHRNHSISQNQKFWKYMLDKKYGEGEAILRLKGNMKSKNYTMRDPAVFRISYTTHYLQKNKYCVWPLYDFESAIEEDLCKITHILRSIEFGEERKELQDFIKDLLGLKKQVYIQYGRIKVKGAITQGRKVRELIQKRRVSGWDDPRLVTIKALKRRGFVPETFYELAKQVGLSKTPTTIDETLLGSINRKIIDQIAPRFMFVPNPVKIKIEGSPKISKLNIKIHPNKLETREIPASNIIYINKEDLRKNRNDEVRFKYLYNAILISHLMLVTRRAKFTGAVPKKNIQILQWVPVKQNIKTEIIMPNGKTIKGLADIGTKKLNVGNIVQFERFGFCRLDKKLANRLIFIFTHK